MSVATNNVPTGANVIKDETGLCIEAPQGAEFVLIDLG